MDVGVGVGETVEALEVGAADDDLVVSIKMYTRLEETHEVVEAKVGVEPVELGDDCVRGVLDGAVAEGVDDGKMPPTRLVIPLIIPPGSPVLCEAAEEGVVWLAVLDGELLGLQRK